MHKYYPKISYVTPVYNQVEFIEQTIKSVINQDYPNFEYIIVDGGSTDGTLDIIKNYESSIFKWISEPDAGMYDALNKGFEMTSGEIMGWINADDLLLPEAFVNMSRLFQDLPDVNWIQGLNVFLDPEGHIIDTQPPKKFSFVKFLIGDFKWIQQESTFWRRNLWEKAGGKFNERLNFAGDFELWFRFFQYSKLYNTTIPIGAWRKRKGQLSGAFMNEYLQEVENITETYDVPKHFRHKIQKTKIMDKVDQVLHLRISENKRTRFYDIGRIGIYYSYEENKFYI